MLREYIPLIGELKNRAHIQGGQLLSLYISGSHLYGWTSKDSDIDIRGMYILKPAEFLGLKQPKSYIRMNQEPYDIDVFEIRKALNLAVKGNCNILEGFAADPIYQTVEYKQVKELIHEKWGAQGVYDSYRGMAWQNYKKFILNGRSTVKKYLYVFRALMAGTYALTTGHIEPNMNVLTKYWREDTVKELLEKKKAGLENEGVGSINTGELDLRVEHWFGKIDTAFLDAGIPNQMANEDIEKINHWLRNWV
jgi:hypothetical protein